MSGDFQFGDRVEQHGDKNIGIVKYQGLSQGPLDPQSVLRDIMAGPSPTSRSAERPPTVNEPPGSTGSYPRRLSVREVAELARVFHRPPSATQVLADAGIPPVRQPSWHGETAEEFWREVADLVEAGIIEDGSTRILAAAAQRFPANEVFQREPSVPD